MSEALERTLQQKKTAVRERIFIPMAYIYLCAMAFIVVSVIASYKYMKEFSVYYIVFIDIAFYIKHINCCHNFTNITHKIIQTVKQLI